MGYVATERFACAGTPVNGELRGLRMVPLGAALWTGAGRLRAQGIRGIAHAAPGSMTLQGRPGFDPTRASVEASIRNAFTLAAAHGCRRLALPFIAGGVFAGRIDPAIEKAELAALIVAACHTHRGEVGAVIVAHGDEDRALFATALAAGSVRGTTLVQGSITRVADHGCDAIANAANMEVRFGGGISGVIGRATGESDEIDREAAAAIGQSSPRRRARSVRNPGSA